MTDNSPDETSPSDSSRRASSLEVLQYLQREGCPWHPDALLYASREVVAWARANGLPGRLDGEPLSDADAHDGPPFHNGPPFGPFGGGPFPPGMAVHMHGGPPPGMPAFLHMPGPFFNAPPPLG